MAKYQITYKCGHLGTVQIFGPVAERDKKAGWIASKNCPECEELRRAEEHAAASLAAAAVNQEAGLPRLVGSEKQIAWAETLRAKALEKMTQEMQEGKERLKKMQRKVNGKIEPFPTERAEEIIIKMEKEMEKLSCEEKATFWIDTRDNPTARLNDIFWEEVQATK